MVESLKLFNQIGKFVQNLDVTLISEERKAILQPLIEYIQEKQEEGEEVRINFICTHNSRRSHLSQIWSQTMAHYFDIKNTYCYSSGTEDTALFPMVVDTLKEQGFMIDTLSKGTNPVYAIKFSSNQHPIIAFSKTLESGFNPDSGFGAVLTCDAANEACPYVTGAERRIPITFKDPKVYDNTPEQKEKYRERSEQIATEFWYVFSQIKSS